MAKKKSDDDIIAMSKELTADFLTQMGLEADITAEFTESDEESEYRYLMINLEGENLNELIGHHGTNLESAQVILGMMLSRTLDDRSLRVLLEINNYKEGREKYLKSYAMRAADQVRSSGQEMELMPMKPAERRVIHMVLKDEEGIETSSTGEGMDRRVVIHKK